MERNAPLLRKVGDHIAAFPTSYNQTAIIETEPGVECGTVACVAGWTAQLASETSQFNLSALTMMIGDYHYDILDGARSLLGLDKSEAMLLFSGGWLPKPSYKGQSHHLAVKDALYALADGADIKEVTATETYLYTDIDIESYVHWA